MSGLEAAGLVLGALPLIIDSQKALRSVTSAAKRVVGIREDKQFLSDASENYQQIQPQLEHLVSLLSSYGEQQLNDEERQLFETVLREYTVLVNTVEQRSRSIKESERQRGKGIFGGKRNSRTAAVRDLSIEVDKRAKQIRDGVELLQALVEGSIRQASGTTVEDDASSFQDELNASTVYLKQANSSPGLTPVQFEEVFPCIPLPDPISHQEDPEEEEDEDEVDATDWSTAEFYSGEKQEAETTVDDSSSIVSTWVPDARSISSSYEDRLPHRTNDHTNEKVMYEVFIYDERGHPHDAKCLLDTGGSLDCVSLQMACRLKLKSKLKRLRNPVSLEIANGDIIAASFVVESFWAFANKPKDCYQLPLYVVKGLPYDMTISERTIFQWDFLLVNLETSSSLNVSTAQEGFERLLPLGLPKLSKAKKATQVQATEDSQSQNEEQRRLEFEEMKHQAAHKKKKRKEQEDSDERDD